EPSRRQVIPPAPLNPASRNTRNLRSRGTQMGKTASNYQHWRGDNKGRANKTTLANEILTEMAKAGITHRDVKGIQTKIQ
ncbi:hypothetical protein VP01_13690g1, partial [Puccinia sorghi]